MKNLILSLVLVLVTISVSSANNNPESSIVLFENEKITVSTTDNNLISLADFNVNESSFDFKTFESVDFIQIYNSNGNLEFQLPVSSDKVRISKNLFGLGNYKVGFLLKGSGDIKFAEVKIK